MRLLRFSHQERIGHDNPLCPIIGPVAAQPSRNSACPDTHIKSRAGLITTCALKSARTGSPHFAENCNLWLGAEPRAWRTVLGRKRRHSYQSLLFVIKA